MKTVKTVVATANVNTAVAARSRDPFVQHLGQRPSGPMKSKRGIIPRKQKHKVIEE